MCRKLICLISFILVLGLVLTGVVAAADPSLVGWWKLDESSGTTAYDSSGNGHDGTLMGNPQSVAGKIDGSLDFDGTDDYVELPTGLIGADIGTAAMWIKTTQDTVGMIFYGSDGTGGDGYGAENELCVSVLTNPANNGVIHLHIEGNPDVYFGPTTVNDDAWHHIAATWDIDGEATLYVDGVSAGSVGHNGSNFNFTGRMRLGSPAANTRFYSGLLDDVRIYNRPLTADDIQELYEWTGEMEKASNPSPDHEATDMSRDVMYISAPILTTSTTLTEPIRWTCCPIKTRAMRRMTLLLFSTLARPISGVLMK